MNKVILTLALAAALFAGDVYAKNDADNFIVTSVYDDKNIYIYFQADKPIVDSAYQFVMDFTKLSKTDGAKQYPLYVTVTARKKVETSGVKDSGAGPIYSEFIQKVSLPIPVDDSLMKRYISKDGLYTVITLPRAKCSAAAKKKQADLIERFVKQYEPTYELGKYLMPVPWSTTYVGEDGAPTRVMTPSMREWLDSMPK